MVVAVVVVGVVRAVGVEHRFYCVRSMLWSIRFHCEIFGVSVVSLRACAYGWRTR